MMDTVKSRKFECVNIADCLLGGEELVEVFAGVRQENTVKELNVSLGTFN